MSWVTSDEYFRFLLNSPEGRKLSAKPTRAGVYINNGKKVAIK